jgi:hypothetical protein
MNETPKNNSGWRKRRALLIWLASFTLIALALVFATSDVPNKPLYILQSLLFGVLGASILVWLGCWRNLRRVLVGSAILATLTAIVYTEENWRGKRAWEQCKRELEAKGMVLDWEKFIPPPVPDDQNFFKASQKIANSFVKSTNDAQAEFLAKQPRFQFGPTTNNSFPTLDTAKTGPIAVAMLNVIPTGGVVPEPAGKQLFLKFNDPIARSQSGEWLQNTLGRSVKGATGVKLSEIQLSRLVAGQIVVQADTPPTLGDLENLILADAATNIGHLRIDATADKTKFQVLLTDAPMTSAADYLKWSDQYEPDFDEIREALQRPYARIDCDYSRPYAIAIPNFVMMRSLAQTLAQRTQCYLLLDQPEKALRELTLLNDSRRILESRPTGKPMTLVASMINVAVSGLYADTLAFGLQLHAWREPQLIALQAQLKTINLPPLVAESLREEPVSASHTLETVTPAAFEALFHRRRTLWQKLSEPEFWLLNVVPRGWRYQNMKVAVTLSQNWIKGFDCTNDLVLPGKVEHGTREVTTQLDHWSPWNLWSRIAIPNFSKAIQTTAKNQTLANQSQIACALERYRLAHGEYPETLDALIPQFMEKVPHDLIGGQPSPGSGPASQPLHYRRTSNGKFLLYSVGWNETDDGGEVALKKDGSEDREKGDWVWKN